VACLHRGYSVYFYERDDALKRDRICLTYNKRVKAIKGLGIASLESGVVSTKHIVHNTEGKVLGEWGMRKWANKPKESAKRTNIHIAETSLRLAL
jgi:hypothetical protein